MSDGAALSGGVRSSWHDASFLPARTQVGLVDAPQTLRSGDCEWKVEMLQAVLGQHASSMEARRKDKRGRERERARERERERRRRRTGAKKGNIWRS